MSNAISSLSFNSINSILYMIMQQGVRPTNFPEELSDWAERFDLEATAEEKQIATNTIRTVLVEDIYPDLSNYPIFKSRVAEILDQDGALFKIIEQEISVLMQNLQEPAGVCITEDSVTISDAHGEIVHWISDEWEEDPQVSLSIANAIHLYHSKGPQHVRDLVKKTAPPVRKSFKVQYTLTGVIGFSELDTPGAVEEYVKSFLQEEESINLDMFTYSQEILEEKPV